LGPLLPDHPTGVTGVGGIIGRGLQPINLQPIKVNGVPRSPLARPGRRTMPPSGVELCPLLPDHPTGVSGIDRTNPRPIKVNSVPRLTSPRPGRGIVPASAGSSYWSHWHRRDNRSWLASDKLVTDKGE
jgi:hypothetical protein